MRIAVISDIHGNWWALEAVLREIEDAGVDEIWCLGDTVGYGPQPARCCAAVAAWSACALAGNHDLGVLGSVALDGFSADALAAALWTRDRLDDAARAFLASLAPAAKRRGAQLVHGSPRDPIWEYVVTDAAASAALADASSPLLLVGHSHVALAVTERDGEIEGGIAPAGKAVDLAGARWLLNPGSVGQPRDGDHRAAWLLLEDGRASFRRTGYDVARTQSELREAGLPAPLGERLALGM